MTQSNAATSTTDISVVGQGGSTSGIPRYQRNISQSQQQQQQRRTSEHLTRGGGILRQVGSSQRTPSAPQLRSMQYTPIQAKFNSITNATAQTRNAAPPVPPHGSTRTSKTSTLNKKTELLSNLPTDYQKSQQQQQQRRTSEHLTRGGGILRQVGSSQRTPSAPQLRSMQYTPIQAKFNSITNATAQTRNAAPPVPPHGSTRTSKTIIGAFTRRPEQTYSTTEGSQPQRYEFSNLREAFIEQRREIQRLRKQLSEKDQLIGQLQNDLRLYEPWR
ncbi:hypothetical protein AHF37_09342 [Paragonimus kellicotti]|nr:hypothetical protein AHF37_09342 [Paragonimus kellicotti]